jgi:excisionase family DNA binding protein
MATCHCARREALSGSEVGLEKLFSIPKAAEQLGISVFTVQCWLSKGKLLRTKVGNRTMIRESELEKLLEDGGKSPAPKRRKN